MKLRKGILGILIMIVIFWTAYGTFFGKVNAKKMSRVVFTSEMKNFNIGDEVKISVNISTEEELSYIEGIVMYDANILEFDKGECCKKENDGRIKLSEENNIGNERKYTITFKAKQKSSNNVIKFEEEPIIKDIEKNKVDVEYNEIIFGSSANKDIKKIENKSSDATLSNIILKNGELGEKFSKDTTSYSVILENKYDYLDIEATPTVEDATVEISETAQNLQEGWNNVEILVTATDEETTKKYVLSVYREKKTAEKKKGSSNGVSSGDSRDINEYNIYNNDNTESRKNDSQSTSKWSFAVEKIGGSIYLVGDYNCKLVELQDTTRIPNGYKSSRVSLCGESLDAFVEENEKNTDFFLLYAENTDTGEEAFYQYDRVENTMQRYYVSNNINSKELEQYRKNLSITIVIIAFLLLVIVFLVIILIRMAFKIQEIKNDIFMN